MDKLQYHRLLALRKSEEEMLFTQIYIARQQGLFVRDIADSIPIPFKRLEYLLYKFNSKGWLDYGTSVWSSWPTGKKKVEWYESSKGYEPKGIEESLNILKQSINDNPPVVQVRIGELCNR